MIKLFSFKDFILSKFRKPRRGLILDNKNIEFKDLKKITTLNHESCWVFEFDIQDSPHKNELIFELCVLDITETMHKYLFVSKTHSENDYIRKQSIIKDWFDDTSITMKKMGVKHPPYRIRLDDSTLCLMCCVNTEDYMRNICENFESIEVFELWSAPYMWGESM